MEFEGLTIERRRHVTAGNKFQNLDVQGTKEWIKGEVLSLSILSLKG